ncbi:HSP-70 cofactor [Porphyromonas cangingivalis]|nr:HSP-70 cofactor [Porphyromonas cangingivalis]
MACRYVSVWCPILLYNNRLSYIVMKEKKCTNDHETQENLQAEVDEQTPVCDTPSEETDKETGETDEMTSLKQQYDELKDSYLRLMAEYDNFRKRTLKEKAELIKSGGERVVTGFLEIADDIELAVSNINGATSMEGVKEGVELIHSKFMSTMKSQGVVEIPTIGEEFDSERYEAVAMVPVTEPAQKGKIIDCIKKGYSLNDKVIRHPKVVVGN